MIDALSGDALSNLLEVQQKCQRDRWRICGDDETREVRSSLVQEVEALFKDTPLVDSMTERKRTTESERTGVYEVESLHGRHQRGGSSGGERGTKARSVNVEGLDMAFFMALKVLSQTDKVQLPSGAKEARNYLKEWHEKYKMFPPCQVAMDFFFGEEKKQERNRCLRAARNCIGEEDFNENSTNIVKEVTSEEMEYLLSSSEELSKVLRSMARNRGDLDGEVCGNSPNATDPKNAYELNEIMSLKEDALRSAKIDGMGKGGGGGRVNVA